MAATLVLSLFLILISSSLLLHHRLPHPGAKLDLKACKFNAIYQLGDSISDTGNLIYEKPGCVFFKFPYGETFFNRSTGRCSNGLLMIDYIALSAGLPLLNPYLSNDSLLTKDQGVNFAVAGSTALSPNVLAEKNIISPLTNSSLSVQLHWMSTHFNSLCLNARDCAEKLKRSLFMVGEIGGNDYNYAFEQQKKTIKEAKDMVPQVVQAIKDAVQTVLGYGALRVVVPGNFPIGCFPICLTGFQTNDSSAYDEYHCLKEANEFSIYHNDYLKIAIEELKQEHPNATIIYGDYYNAFQWVFRHASNLGFDASSLLKSCCGIGGDYNFSLAKRCGASGVPVCSNPDQRISWDGVHPTQKAYHYMSDWLIRDLLPRLGCGPV
ncbi:GDSL esterase/lipase At5g03980-like isoform X1 [Ziziphus jujuba]|uniref:GDSL esterase/lipase At5g03980-like isoform X1 n=1 Tax=Ziziphus jujuba TaxID=326968 RepID=A0A6P3ZN46_ZIZJJ|nr:GDSL esterase/lipase At5g03980-like isoform X1 [Ziziphus jujuba]